MIRFISCKTPPKPVMPTIAPDTNQQVTGAMDFWHPQVVVASNLCPAATTAIAPTNTGAFGSGTTRLIAICPATATATCRSSGKRSLQRRVLQHRAVEPVTDDLAGENHRVLAQREVLVRDGIWGRPGLV